MSSASCTVALDEAIRDVGVQKDHAVCVPVFVGPTVGSGMIRWRHMRLRRFLLGLSST